jgi:hypothetical protein
MKWFAVTIRRAAPRRGIAAVLLLASPLMLCFAPRMVIANDGSPPPSEPSGAPPPIRVYVFTSPPPNGIGDPDYLRRAEAVADIKATMRGKTRVVPVEGSSEADVTVEVTFRDYSRSRTGVRLRAGVLTTDIERASRGLVAGGGLGAGHWVAGKIGEDMQKWITEHRDAILAARKDKVTPSMPVPPAGNPVGTSV